MLRLSPEMTIEELRMLLFDLPGHTAVEIEAGISITRHGSFTRRHGKGR
jgi:hypothetical protein